MRRAAASMAELIFAISASSHSPGRSREPRRLLPRPPLSRPEERLPSAPSSCIVALCMKRRAARSPAHSAGSSSGADAAVAGAS